MSAIDLQALSASASGCQQWQHDVLSDVACALRVPAARLAIWEPSVCASAAGKLQVVIDVLPAKFGHTPTELVSRLAVQVKEPGSPIWKGYATRYLDASQAMGLSASAVFVPAPSVPPPPPSPPPPQQHWVRGTLMRVSESVMSPGGLESDKVGSATPRVSGDGNKVVFYSDATFSSAGFEEDNDYHIWM